MGTKLGYRHRQSCTTGYRLARWGDGKFSVNVNRRRKYDCRACCAERIGKQLRGLYSLESVTVDFQPKTRREAIKKFAQRKGQLLGVYTYEHIPDILVISTHVVLVSGYTFPVDAAVRFVIEQGVELVPKGWSHNTNFPTVIDEPIGAEVVNWPSYVTKQDRAEILKLLGWRRGNVNRKHDGIPLEHLLQSACDAYVNGRLDHAWTCPPLAVSVVQDSGDNWDDLESGEEGWIWDDGG